MSDVDKQRNLAMAVAAVFAIGFAGAVGYLAGHSGEGAPNRPEIGAPAPVAARAESPSVAEAAPLLGATAAPRSATREEAERAPARGSARPEASAPVAGQREAHASREVAEPPAESGAGEAEAIAASAASAAGADPGRASVAPPPASPVEIPSGTKIELALAEPVSSQTARVGDAVAATLTAPIRIDGEIAVHSGTRVVGRISEAKPLAKVGGQARLAISFESLEIGSESATIAAAWAREGKSETGKDAATIAAGAAIGTVIGNQSKKNDRGKVLGAILGAGVGTAVAAATPGEAIELPAGARLEVTLRQATTVPPPG